MKMTCAFTASLLVVCGMEVSQAAEAPAPHDSPFPLQLEARVPFAPTAVQSAGHASLVYELYLTNFSNSPLSLSRIEVLDAEGPSSKPFASFEGAKLDAILRPLAAQPAENKSGPHVLAAGTTLVAFMWVSFENGANVPTRLRHNVVTTTSSIDGPVIDTHHTELRVFASPLHGAGWTASDGPSNDLDNHHRTGIFVMHGQLTLSRRYAIDWMRNSSDAARDPHDEHLYPAYGQPVFAVSDATVLKTQDGLPDNVPGPVATFHTALPITLENVGGNYVVLDLGGGQYAWYFHLQAGSLKVRPGEHVRRSQALAQIGCSGDSTLPHLHFEVTNSPTMLAGDGIPYVLDHYRISTADNVWESRRRELPLRDMLVDFGP